MGMGGNGCRKRDASGNAGRTIGKKRARFSKKGGAVEEEGQQSARNTVRTGNCMWEKVASIKHAFFPHCFFSKPRM